MELALQRFGRLAGLEREKLLAAWPRQHEIAFDTETKMMATAHRSEDRLFVAVKGAPESVMEASTTLGEDRTHISGEEREEWLRRAGALAAEGLRVLALAEATIPLEAIPAYESLNFPRPGRVP